MDITNIFTILLILAGFIGLFLVVRKQQTREEREGSENMKIMVDWVREMKRDIQDTRDQMNRNLNDNTQAINTRLHENTSQINFRLTEAAKVIGDIQRQLGSVSQIGPDIRRLSETLASPKMRGNFGEEIMENMLSQVLPVGSYRLQHKFSSGDTVDAAIAIGQHILSVDSKFSMENFRLMNESKEDSSYETLKRAFLKDTKKRIDEIHKKYILPEENTFDFALMFVPSEGVYQEIIKDIEVTEYSRNKRVYAVSPNSLYMYLQSIMMSMRGLEMNKKAQEVLKLITGIRQETDKFGKNLGVLATHVKNTYNTMGAVGQDFSKLQNRVVSAAALELDETQEANAELLE